MCTPVLLIQVLVSAKKRDFLSEEVPQPAPT